MNRKLSWPYGGDDHLERIRCEEFDGIEEEDTNFIDGILGSYCKLLRRIGNGTTTMECHHDYDAAATTTKESAMT